MPWLYLKGISTGDFSEALAALLGPDAPGLSASTITRLKADWWDDHERWPRRDLSAQRHVYFWADGVYFSHRLDEDRQCMLVIIGAPPPHGLQANHCRAMDEWGNKGVLGLTCGFRESTHSWRELLLDLKRRGLEVAPKLAVGDGAMGFWAALHEVYGKARVQRCWGHMAANVLNAMPKSVQPKAHLKDICPLGQASMPCRVTDGGNQGGRQCCLRFLRRGLRREIRSRCQMPDQGSRRPAGILRFSSRALASTSGPATRSRAPIPPSGIEPPRPRAA